MAATTEKEGGETKGVESFDSAESIAAIASRHLTRQGAVVVQAGGGKDLLLDKDHINHLEGDYVVVDPSTLGGRYGNISWTDDRTHFVDPREYGDDPLYVATDIPSIVESVREFEHGLSYEEELRRGMSEWAQFVRDLNTPYVLSFEISGDSSEYFEDDRLSEEAYSDLLQGLDVSESGLEPREGFIVENYPLK